MQKILILISLSITSTALLGVTVKPVPKIQWTPNQIAATQKVCVSSAQEANPSATKEQAAYFCNCALAEAANKWTYEDFARNEERYTQQLGNEGVISRCARATFQIVPESNRKVEPNAVQPNRSLEVLGQSLFKKRGGSDQFKQVLESLGQSLLNKRGGITN